MLLGVTGLLELAQSKLHVSRAPLRLGGFQELLTRNVAHGRKALEALFEGPLRFTAPQTDDGRRFLVEGAAAGSFLFPVLKASPRGFERGHFGAI